MLTSRRLILIDNSVSPFKLRTIPLETIITVFAGMDVKGDPIITLSHMDTSGTGAPHPIDFIFHRQKGEQRTKECNEWAATLTKHAAEARDGALSAGTLPYDAVKVLQPRMTATYRIETFSPHKPLMEEYPKLAEPLITPVLPISTVDCGIPAEADEPVPLINAEMGEPSNSSCLPPLDLEEAGMPDTGEAGSLLREIAVEADEEQAISDAARTWADAVRTAITPQPVLPGLAIGVISDVENNKAEPEADEDLPSSTPDEAVAEINKDIISLNASIPEYPVNASMPECPNDAKIPECPVNASIPEYPVDAKIPESQVNASIPEYPTDGDPVEQPVPETPLIPAAISPPVPIILKNRSSSVLIAAIVVVILVVLGAAFIGSFSQPETRETPLPVVLTVITVQPVSTLLPTLVPADGIWVRIEYPGTFIGEVGNSELMHPVSGTGLRYYKILRSDRIVQASARKQENSGDTLLLEIYNNGTLIKRSSTRAPMGSIDILIDPLTGKPPGIGHLDNT
jgi:hypothetical protein